MKEKRSRFGAALTALIMLAVLAPAWISEPASSSTAPPQRSAATVDDEIRFIKSLVDRISVEELRKDILALQSAGTRFSPSRGNARAAEYIKASLLAAGIKDVTLDEFTYYDDQTGRYETSRNVVAIKPGIKTPGRIVIIGAHFDSISRRAEQGQVSALDIENPAPGADDNGTGVAAMLAAARHLGPYEFDCTLRFIAFSAEEAGLFGSAHYAAECARRGEDLIGVVNVDMIGYAKEQPEDLDVLSNRKSEWLLDRITNNAPVYASGLHVYRRIDETYDGSDHAPFWNNGYAAVCFMEDYYPSAKFYHSPQDTIEKIDFPFLLSGTRLAAGSVAELAGVRIKDSPAELTETYERNRLDCVDWKRDSGKRFLLTISPETNQANVIDISLPMVSSNAALSLGDIPPETWGQPRNYPSAASLRPRTRLVYVPMIALRSPAAGSENGIVKVIDVGKMTIAAEFGVGRYPTEGCFNDEGTRYYQPYWGERFIDVIDTTTLARVARVASPSPLSKLVAATDHRRAVGMSAEIGSIAVFDLASGKSERLVPGLIDPSDIVLVNDKTAFVSSGRNAMIYQIDLDRGRITGESETGPRPTRLLLSPQRDIVVALHKLSSRIDIYNVNASNGGAVSLKRKTVLDTGDEIVGGTFAGNVACYLISSNRSRLFGLDLSAARVFWAMRTGGVRPSADVGRIVFLEE